MAETTTIEIEKSDWTRLNGRKEPGDGFKDVVSRVLDTIEAAENADLLAELDRDPSPIRERAEKVAETPGQLALEETTDEPGAAQDAAEDDTADAGATVETVDISGGEYEEADRRDALRYAVEFIEAEGEVTAAKIRETVHEECETHYASARSTWKNFLQPALSKIEDVQLVNRSRGKWAPAGVDQ